MTFDPLSFIYEGIYSARLLASASVFACFFLEKKEGFRWKVNLIYGLFILFYASFSPFVDFLNERGFTTEQLTPIHLVWYAALPVTHYFAFRSCFKGSWSGTLFTYACGVLAECAFFGWFYLFYDFGVFTLRGHTPVAVGVEIGLSVVVFIAVYFALYCYEKKHPMKEIFNASHALLSVAVIAGITFMRLQLQSVYEVVKDMPQSKIVSFTLGAVPLLFLAIVFSFNRYQENKQDGVVLNQILSERERQYKNSVENVEIINRKCHDLRKQLRALEFVSEEERGKALSEITDSINIYDSEIKTDNPALNALLNEKGLTCLSKGINFTKIVDGNALSFMNSVDLYTLLGNMLDNAVEASEKVEDGQKRVISLNIHKAGGFVVLRMDNYCNEPPAMKNGIPVTSKSDKNYHGYGVKSIRHVAEKYGGSVSLNVSENIFTVLVTVPEQ